MAERTKAGSGSSTDAKASQQRSSVVSRLGRGLGALIPAAPVTQPPPQQRSGSGKGAGGDNGATGTDGVTALTKLDIPAETRGTARVVQMERPLEPRVERSTGNTATADLGDGAAVVEIPISLIARNSRQPRERFDERAIAQLADSIRLHGLLQPITVRRLSTPRGGKTFELIAGERRLRAFESLQRTAIPAIGRIADDSQSATLALIENIQREDLNPMERAKGLERLIGEFGWTQQQAGERVGLDRATIANLLRLNELDQFTSACVRDGRLTQGHAKALLSIDTPQLRRSLAERALHDEWSVRQLEREVQRAKSAAGAPISSAPSTTRKASVPISDLERRLGVFLGTKVAIRKGRKSGSGSMTIQFFSLDQFDGLLNRLGFDPNSLSD
ncbi:MAG: ParB/RepB/Spo0J family partition protein [Planctomycetes bacterium]|nr:ParB/RepB/Spo0J family partition protein [Planctomycetota bacterium]